MKKTKSMPAGEKPNFTKRAFLKSEYYRGKQDVLNALLDDDKMYTIDEVNNLIETFLKGKVN